MRKSPPAVSAVNSHTGIGVPPPEVREKRARSRRDAPDECPVAAFDEVFDEFRCFFHGRHRYYGFYFAY